jgi:hypothetical protein
MQEFQLSSVQILESWMLQWPTAASKAQENHNLRAQKLLPLLRPVEQLLEHWGVESIAPVGAQIPYNPQQHQLWKEKPSPEIPSKSATQATDKATNSSTAPKLALFD